MFRQLDQHCRHDAILASNTSTLDINEIASATQHPENVLGLHFFSPAHISRRLRAGSPFAQNRRSDRWQASLLLQRRARKETALSDTR